MRIPWGLNIAACSFELSIHIVLQQCSHARFVRSRYNVSPRANSGKLYNYFLHFSGGRMN